MVIRPVLADSGKKEQIWYWPVLASLWVKGLIMGSKSALSWIKSHGFIVRWPYHVEKLLWIYNVDLIYKGKNVNRKGEPLYNVGSSFSYKLVSQEANCATFSPSFHQCSFLQVFSYYKVHWTERSQNKDVKTPGIELRTSCTEGSTLASFTPDITCSTITY